MIRVEGEFHTVVDIIGYDCLPKNIEDAPLQYLVQFNPPLKITNFNFHPLALADAKNVSTIVAAMAPKESAFIDCIDTSSNKTNLKWVFYEKENHSYACFTSNF